MRLQTGNRLGHYEIIAYLGAGGMGEVYLAEDARLRRKIALKVLPQSIAQDQARLGRFEQEALAASALNHPNILTIHEFGAERGTHFLASEFIDGETLRARLDRAPLSVQESVDIAAQTAQALAAAHEASIIHRDIKPENVMIRRDGIIKVLDFGLAKLVEPAPLDTEAETHGLALTQAGTVMATAQYMSPEQARGKPIDVRTDVFSLGVMLYEMLARRRPFTGETLSHVIVAILEKEPPALPQAVPADLEKIVARALAKNVEERYPNAQALLADLKKLHIRLLMGAELERASALGEPAEAETAPPGQATTGAKDKPGTAGPRTSGRWTATVNWVLAASLSLGAVAAGFLAYRSSSPDRDVESIAVMPFVNESGNADVEYLSDGMTETLIGSLSRLPNLNVKARSSVFRYKGKTIDARTIARDLNVQAILNGRVVQRSDQVTVNLELVDGETENVLWTGQYHRSQTELISLQSDLARDVSSQLRTRLSGTDEQKLATKHTENAEAFQLYLKGRYFWNKRTNEGYQQAIQFFRQATDRDPTYALAYVGLADAHAFLRVRGQSGGDAYRKAKSIVQRALEIDDTLGEAHTTMAMLTQNSDWDLTNAAARYQRAIELSPNYATAHHWYGELLIQMGRIEQGLARYERALDIDPLSMVISSDLALGYYYARQHGRALEQLQKTIDMDPNFFRTYLYRARVYEREDQYDSAIADREKGLLLVGEDPKRVAHVTAALREAWTAGGTRGYWEKRLEIGQQHPGLRNEWECDLAGIQARLGDKDGAFASLERAYEERLFDVLFLKASPEFDALRSDARFQDLVRRVGLPQ